MGKRKRWFIMHVRLAHLYKNVEVHRERKQKAVSLKSNFEKIGRVSFCTFGILSMTAAIRKMSPQLFDGLSTDFHIDAIKNVNDFCLITGLIVGIVAVHLADHQERIIDSQRESLRLAKRELKEGISAARAQLIREIAEIESRLHEYESLSRPSALRLVQGEERLPRLEPIKGEFKQQLDQIKAGIDPDLDLEQEEHGWKIS